MSAGGEAPISHHRKERPFQGRMARLGLEDAIG
jgi:hypothetical protein